MEFRISYNQLEYYEYQIERLEKERSKIVQLGRLTAYQDNRLSDIDDEISYWQHVIKKAHASLNSS